MPCPICNQNIGNGVDHRWCLVELFKTNKIKSVAEWEALSAKPKTIFKRKVKALLPVQTN